MLGLIFTVLLNFAAFANPTQTDSTVSNNQPKYAVIGDILIKGNKTTRNFIILRELPFKTADTIELSQFNKALLQGKQNLLNTYLFNFVTITSTSDDSSKKTTVNIEVKEGWYTWPYPIFDLVDRNFNEWLNSGASFQRIDYGGTVEQHNVRGRNETASISYEGGFDQLYDFSYSMPYITRKQVHGLSFDINYFRSHEIAYNTIDNLQRLFRIPDTYLAKAFNTSLKYTYRPGLYTRQTLTLGYKSLNIADTVLRKNTYFFSNKGNTQQSFTIEYTFRADYRDYKLYALKGGFFEFVLNKRSLGLAFENSDMLFTDITYHKYWPLLDRLYFSSGIEAIDVLYGSHDYVSQVALGYESNYIRGYEHYVISGQHWIMCKNNLKIAIVQNKIVKLKFIPTEKFSTIPNSVYLNINADVAYVKANLFTNALPYNNTYTNIPLYSAGLGLDYLTYYGWLLRIEYTVNHTGMAGFQIHFTNPI